MTDTSLALANNLPAAQILCTMNPAQQQAFARLVTIAVREVKATDMHVVDSQCHICSPGGRFHAVINLEEMLGAKVSLAFGLTKSTPVGLKKIRGAADAIYLEQDSGILVTDGSTQCVLLLPFDSSTPLPPAIESSHFRGVEIKDLCPKRLQDALGKGGYTTLRVFDGQLEQACRNGGSPYTFNPASFFHLMEKTPELELISTYLGTGCSGKAMSIQLAENERGYWLVTSAKLAINAAFKSYELLVNI